MRALVLSAIAAALIATPTLAADVAVNDAWFRALPGKLPAGGYFTLHNAGVTSVTLTGASSPACGMLMLHKTENEGGTGMMMDMPSIVVPAGGDVTFAPGGYHLMCNDPTQAMKPGTRVTVTLEFAGGAKLTESFVVKDARGK
jgi:periplasmic copper chaperone A